MKSWSLRYHRGFGETCSLHLWDSQILQQEKAAVIITELLPRLQTPAFRRTGAVKSLLQRMWILLTYSKHVLPSILEVPSAVTMKFQVSGDVMLCRWVNISRRFDAPHTFSSHICNRALVTSGHIHPTTQRKVPEDLKSLCSECYGHIGVQHTTKFRFQNTDFWFHILLPFIFCFCFVLYVLKIYYFSTCALVFTNCPASLNVLLWR